MLSMRKTVVALATAALAVAVAAQQPGLCLDPQLINGLVFLGRPDQKAVVAPGQASFMKDVRMPAQLLLIGSAERDNGLATVAYRTSLSPDKAHAAAADALAAAGWLPEPRTAAATFSVAGAAPRNEVFCHDGETRQLLVRDINGARYVNIVHFAQAGSRQCGADPAMESMSMMAIRNLLPGIRFPEDASPAFPLGAGGGSNSLFTTTSRIISSRTPGSLLDYIAGQLQDQGWQPDASWTSGSSAGSTWHRTHDGEPVSGTLEIMRAGDGTLEMEFTVAMPD